MKKSLVVLFCLVSFQICRSQELPDLKTYRSDIGFNTNFVFNQIFNSGGTGSPFDLMLKKQKNANSVFRYGLSIYLNHSNDINAFYGYNQYSFYNLSISVGKEFQKQINKHWVFYYGADLAPFYSFDDRKYYSQDYNTSNLNYHLQSQSSTNSYGIKVIPFLGIRFNINERLYVATQTNLICSLNKKVTTQTVIDNNNSGPNNYVYNSANKSFNEGSLHITPASGIFFFYRF